MQIYICRIDRKLRTTTVASGRRIGQMGVKDAKIFPCKSFCITWILNHVDILPPLKKRWSSLSFWLVKKQIILSSLYVLGVYHVPATVPEISLITKNLSEEGTCELDQTVSGKGNMCSTYRGEGWKDKPSGVSGHCVCVYRHMCAQVYITLTLVHFITDPHPWRWQDQHFTRVPESCGAGKPLLDSVF